MPAEAGTACITRKTAVSLLAICNAGYSFLETAILSPTKKSLSPPEDSRTMKNVEATTNTLGTSIIPPIVPPNTAIRATLNTNKEKQRTT